MSQIERAGHSRPYQGYPYVNPVVVDVQELNPEEMAAMARWQHLPRRLIGQREEAGGSGNIVSAAVSRPEESKEDPNDRPVVYIDIPESNASGISQTREEDGEPTFVQETIFYDPFKDRRIDMGGSETEGEAPEAIAGSSRPSPPNNLALGGAGSYSYSSPHSSQGLPPMLSKETNVYGHQPSPDDGFPLSPIPVSEFPEPPPSYDDIDTRETAPVETTQPPRTQVITPPSAAQESRQTMHCEYCDATVKTIVVKQNGFWTHVLAIMCCVCLPMVLLVYWCDCTKYKNHYCPACNKRLASESPI